MIHFLSKIKTPFKFYSNSASNLFGIRPKRIVFNRFAIPFIWSLASIWYFWSHKKINCSQVEVNVQKFQTRRDKMKLQTITESKRSIFGIIWSVCEHILRFFQLLLIFSPVIALFPFRKYNFAKDLWLNLFVSAVQRAGVVWIKAFQYMSHRRDIIGQDMADKFMHLRENAPQHPFKVTKQTFKKSYGRSIFEVFDSFQDEPIASGSVSQVYKAVYKGKKVAVKVRHPGVEKYIQRDINILFFFSHFLTLFSRRFRLPVNQVSMKKTLIDQIDFNNEKDNLIIFNSLFEGRKQVKFPIPLIQQTSESFLVETFVEGVPITYYEKHPHPLNNVIARIGATTFFQMLMKFNFIHADCHGGNIMVEVKQKTQNYFTKAKEFVDEIYQKFQDYISLMSLKSDTLRQLFKQSKEQQNEVKRILKKSSQKVEMTLIDVGMVIRLDEKDRQNFINFIRSVLHGQGEKCAQMIYNLSIFDGKKIISGKFETYMAQLQNLFKILNGHPLQDLQGVQLFVGMLNIIREHNMKLQGQFATLLTNMLVLQAMAKDLNPNINILKCAVPYFKYVNQPVVVKNTI